MTVDGFLLETPCSYNIKTECYYITDILLAIEELNTSNQAYTFYKFANTKLVEFMFILIYEEKRQKENTSHKNLNIEQHEHCKKPGVNSSVP